MQQTPSTRKNGKSREVLRCKSMGKKLLEGVTFKQKGTQCVAKECLKEPFGTPYVKICSMEAAKEEFAKSEPSIGKRFVWELLDKSKGVAELLSRQQILRISTTSF